MSENTNVEKVETAKDEKLTVEYVLAQLERIGEDSAYIEAALGGLASVETACPGDIGAQEKAKGMADVVRARETTNQQLIRFYEKVYDDIRRKNAMIEISAEERKQFVDFVRDTTVASQSNTPGALPAMLPDFDKIWKTVFLGE